MQYPENNILEFEQELQQQRNSKKRPLQDQVTTKQNKKKVIIIGDRMIKKTDGYFLKC